MRGPAPVKPDGKVITLAEVPECWGPQ